jgi:hypothetical protein
MNSISRRNALKAIAGALLLPLVPVELKAKTQPTVIDPQAAFLAMQEAWARDSLALLKRRPYMARLVHRDYAAHKAMDKTIEVPRP